ncbi:hypothetical protein [Sanguibacter sp. HDW7]|uniref:hypothetical protein n=1 Tax=Sanguibacter sp. HDW7 TaxID=2714931 RepID=UPI001408E305|nr:hypothetical protein [Sanguibacter sp. HDW7]QIK82673.1 hypothetical protein G7063_02835 [Sanguibacter sp. HDW7]
MMMNSPKKPIRTVAPGVRWLPRRAVALSLMLTACAGTLVLAACDDAASSAPSVVAPSPAPTPDVPASDAPSRASRELGDGRGETAGGTAGDEAVPGEQSAEPDEGWPGDKFVRGLGLRGHDAR